LKLRINFAIFTLSKFNQMYSKMDAQNNPLGKATNVLQELRPLISSKDREAAEKELNVSPVTIIRYLNGNAKKIDTATQLIQFFKRRIEERDRIITAA
jgi:hypothetical protein